MLWLANKQSNTLTKCQVHLDTNFEQKHNKLTRYENEYIHQSNWEQLIKDNATDDELPDKFSVKPLRSDSKSNAQNVISIIISIIFTRE